MKTQTGRLALVMVMLWIGFRVGHRAEAGGIALNTPAGLSPGESFRFVFITDGATTAISSSIATYNSFVNVQAGSAAYAGSVVNWVAIGSTSSVSAVNNVGQTTTPVYLADGTLITTSTTSTGLWSGSILNPIDEDLAGLGVHSGSTGVWSGTNTNGSTSANHLGDFFGVTIGSTSATTAAWVNDGSWPSDTTSGVFPIYGISQVLTAVPEPSTLWMAGPALLAVAALCWSRSRRAVPTPGEDRDSTCAFPSLPMHTGD
ncbi:MAG TPA: PEP-CTERM sorting domain-containing protein [Isosphaeraceae bacterium]|nr:PEP-CTERM sorting domain-containing protein [Isosphaeraceae bacterium]